MPVLSPSATPAARTARARRLLVLLLGVAALVVVLQPVDAWVWRQARVPDIYGTDWGRLLRVAGYAPTWILGALVLAAGRWTLRRTAGWRTAFLPAIALALSVGVAGVAGEILKLVVRRGRPAAGDGLYSFAGWDLATLNTGSYGFPSTHAVVAFAAAFALARLAPRTGWVWLALALGCGATRVLAGAHFVSDVLAAGLLAWGTVVVLFEVLRPPEIVGK